jgi:hypothetical protein
MNFESGSKAHHAATSNLDGAKRYIADPAYFIC